MVRAFANDVGLAVELLCLDAAASFGDDYLLDGLDRVRLHRPLKAGRLPQHLRTSEQVLGLFGEVCMAVSSWLAPRAGGLQWLVIPGDRFEVFAAVIAAYYSNVPIAHLFGGDRSQGGHLDDSVRHAISKLSHVHFPVCSDSALRLLNLGEESWRVMNVGSPVVESVLEVVAREEINIGQWVAKRKYNLICTYHPITTEPGDAGRQFRSLLNAIFRVAEREDISCIFTHPNNEVGSAAILAELASIPDAPNFRVYPSLGWKDYLRVLSCCDLVVGNSSSAMLEAPILAVPALDVGTRQKGRYCPASVNREESYDSEAIAEKILQMLRAKTRPAVDHPYGDGSTSRLIHESLVRISQQVPRKDILQKRITY